MARSKNDNSEHSLFKQALIDAERVLKISDNPLAPDLLQAVKLLQDNLLKSDIQAIDKILKSHKYPSHSITFVKFFIECEIWEHLSLPACRILLRMCRKMSLDCCYLLNRDVLCDVLKISKRTMIRAVEELEEMGCITKLCTYKRSTKDHNSGTVYMINSYIATVGKSRNVETYKRIVPDELLNVFEDNCYNSTDTISSKIDLPDGQYSFNYEVMITENA